MDEFAHKARVNFAGLLVRVFVHKHDVEVAAVAQFFSAQLAITHDGNKRLVTVTLLETLPHPAAGDLQHAVGQSTQVVRHLLDRQAALHISGQGAKHLAMMGAAQQIEQ